MLRIIRSSQTLLLTSVSACLVSVGVFIFLLNQGNRLSYAQVAVLNYSADQVIVLINKERQLRSLKALHKNDTLTLAAENKTADMIKNDYFSHVSPSDGKKWSDFIQEAKYDYLEAGENLASGYLNAKEMVKAWMNSPTHRANILADGYEETGVAVSKGKLKGSETIFVTQVFGRR